MQESKHGRSRQRGSSEPIAQVAWCCAAAFLFVSFVALDASDCARLPDFRKTVVFASTEDPPQIVDSRNPLSEPESEAVIDSLQREAGATDILERHIELVEAITGNPLVRGNRVTLLRDGPETFAAMSRAIQDAQKHIHLETFIIRDDKVGRPLSGLLLEKQAEGVQVRVIYDSFGCSKTPRAFFERMRAGGIQVYEFNPLAITDLLGKWTINNRDHRKILVVDGRIAFTGGLNFYRVYSRSPASGSGGGYIEEPDSEADLYWRDTHVRIAGPVVADFQKLFLDMWRRRNKIEGVRSDYFPPLAQEGDALVRVIASTPVQPVPHIYATYMSAINHASDTIHITQAYFLPGEDMLKALARAVARGVDVKIIVPGVSDFWMPIYAGRATYSPLLKSGLMLPTTSADRLSRVLAKGSTTAGWLNVKGILSPSPVYLRV